MDELTDWDVEFIERMMGGGNKNAGHIVTTKTGKTGRTYSHEYLVNGKVRVYLNDGGKLLCDPDTLTVKGFID